MLVEIKLLLSSRNLVYVRLCVSALRLLITSSVMWHDSMLLYITAVVNTVSKCDLRETVVHK